MENDKVENNDLPEKLDKPSTLEEIITEEASVSSNLKDDVDEEVPSKDAIPEESDSNDMDIKQEEQARKEPSKTEISVSKESFFKRRKEKKLKKKSKILMYGDSFDIKYRGPIGIRGLRIIAWVMMIASAIAIALLQALNSGVIAKEHISSCIIWIDVLELMGVLAVPCFMLSKFAMIFQKKGGYKGILLTYGGMALGIAVAFLVAYFHYGIKAVMVFLDYDYKQAETELENALLRFTEKKLSFNCFIDMFLWSLYFAIASFDFKKPKAWKTMIQKILCLLPIGYSLFCFIIKFYFVSGQVQLSPILLPFLTTSSPLVFFAFIFITRFMNKRKKLYMKIGGTQEGYREYLKTNANSLHFALLNVLSFVITGFLDLFIILIVLLVNYNNLEYFKNLMIATGMSDCFAYILFSPLILLFSYTKKFENNKFDFMIPIIGIVIMALIIIEGSYYSFLEWISYLKTLIKR